jgi:hypothetical protein
MKRILIFGLLAMVAGLAVTGCESVDMSNREKQEKLLQEADRQSGLPNITNFAEKKMLKALLELRDRNAPTYTYLRDMNGKVSLLCNSMGYPVPYGAQYTNPQKGGVHTGYSLPQAEPNGVFSPSTAEASFVMCSDGKGNIAPVYVEDRVMTSPFKINANGTIDTSEKPTIVMPKESTNFN